MNWATPTSSQNKYGMSLSSTTCIHFSALSRYAFGQASTFLSFHVWWMIRGILELGMWPWGSELVLLRTSSAAAKMASIGLVDLSVHSFGRCKAVCKAKRSVGDTPGLSTDCNLPPPFTRLPRMYFVSSGCSSCSFLTAVLCDCRNEFQQTSAARTIANVASRLQCRGSSILQSSRIRIAG